MTYIVRSISVNKTNWGLPPEYLQPHWYVAYTYANHENRVAFQLRQHQIQHFLPTYETQRRWKDRRVRLEMPLFPGYVFVFLALRDRLEVLQLPGVARLVVGFNGHPAALEGEEIEHLRKSLRQLRAKPHPYLMVGCRVRIRTGPLLGAEGILVRRKSNCRVVLSIGLIMRSVAVEVDIADIEFLAR